MAFEGRAERLAWVASVASPQGICTFSGGWMNHELFEEARYCYVYGQFAAAALLGFAFVERTLAALAFRQGNDAAERRTGQHLIQDAVKAGWLTVEEGDALQKARELRNPLTHYRRPLHADTVEARAGQADVDPYEVLAADAREILLVMFRMVAKQALG